MPNPEELCRFALEMVDETDATVLRLLAAELTVETKADATLVTQVDTQIEARLRARIGQRYPSHAILGEELGSAAGAGGVRWIIDPIDGTHNLVRGIPVFATLIAAELNGELAAAVVSAPALARRWYAWRRGGSHVRDVIGERQIHVSDVTDIAEAQLVWSGMRAMHEAGHADAILRLARAAWRDRGFGDFWGYMLVAEGAAESMAEVGPTTWDLAAPALIVREAGGRLTDFAGKDSYAGPQALASNGRVHADLVKALAGG